MEEEANIPVVARRLKKVLEERVLHKEIQSNEEARLLDSAARQEGKSSERITTLVPVSARKMQGIKNSGGWKPDRGKVGGEPLNVLQGRAQLTVIDLGNFHARGGKKLTEGGAWPKEGL